MERTARDPVCGMSFSIACCTPREAGASRLLKPFSCRQESFDRSMGLCLTNRDNMCVIRIGVWVNSGTAENEIDAVIAHETFHLYTSLKEWMYGGNAGIHINSHYDEDEAYHFKKLYGLVWKVVHDTLKKPKQASASGQAKRRKVKA